jgi:Holliday junction resolvase-like predicted endonuclease
MNSRLTQIGFSQRVRLEWLERTANLVLAGNDDMSIYDVLQEQLEDKLSVDRSVDEPSVRRPASKKDNLRTHDAGRVTPSRIYRGNREKVITILMKIWVRPPRDLHSLQEEGLKLLLHLSREDHIAVHWGMAMAVYPFWGAVAAHVGRLLRLQGTAAASQVQRRVREQYGERDTVSRAARRVLRSFVDWEVLKETSGKGIYTAGLSLAITQVKVIAWLAEAFLHAQPNGSAALRTVLDSTSLFPFRLSHISPVHLVSVSGRLDVLRHGLDQDLIMLRTEKWPAVKEGES